MKVSKLKIIALVLTAVAGMASAANAFDLRAAISAARPGDTIRVPAGIYAGPIVIDKPITLMGLPGAVLDGHERGDVVLIKSAGATLSGFVIRGSGDDLERENSAVWVLAPHVTVEHNVLQDDLFGIYVKQADHTTIRDNTISGKALDTGRRGDAIKLWYSANCLIDSNHVENVRDCVIWFSHDVRITNNHVSHSRYGLHFMFCDNNTLIGNWLEDNSIGTYLMNSRHLVLHGNVLAGNRGPSGYGLGLKDMDGVDAQDNRIVGNRIGIYIDNSPQSFDVYDEFVRNLLAYNDVGIAMLPNVQRNKFHDNSFVENEEQVATLGSGQLKNNIFTVNGRGNFWSDYKGFDQNGDGIGDLPYRCQSLFENLMDREPKLRFFLYSPAQQAIELASQAFPAVKPQPKFSDDAPLMRPVELHVPATAGTFAWQPLAGGLGLLMVGSLPVVGQTVRRRSKRAPAGAMGVSPERSEPEVANRQHGADGRATGCVLEVEGLTKRFGRFTALNGLSFQLGAGQALALWGGNGAGKTTAIRCILGLTRCKGRVSVAGRDLRRSGKALRGMIGYVSQESGFQGDLKVVEALRLYARIKGAPMERVDQLLAEVGLADHGSKRVANLSGGMRKRLALAAALLNDPPLLILDEIAANLDAEGRHSFLQLLGHLKQQGKTILFTSHRLDEVEMLADRVLVLERGTLKHDCSPRDLGPTLGIHCEVKLFVPEKLIEPALGILHTSGFSAQRHGRGIWVRVEPHRKAAPIHTLARHEILIENFEVETQDGEQSHA